MKKRIPEYYRTMYLDGYTPEEILWATHNKLIKDMQPAEEFAEVKITTEVKK